MDGVLKSLGSIEAIFASPKSDASWPYRNAQAFRR